MRHALVYLSVAVCFCLFPLLGCSQKEERQEPIIIGSSLPLTGPDASYGQHAKRGMELALEKINREGGIKGRKIKIIFDDDEGVPKNGASIMNKFATERSIQVVIGAVHSTVTLAMASLANKHRILLISPISSSAQLTRDGGPYFFRVAPSDAFQARVLAQWLFDLGFRQAGIAYVKNIWGDSLAREFENHFANKGGKIVAKEASVVGQMDFRTQLIKLRNADPDVLLFLTQAKEGGKLIKQSRELGFNIPIFGGDTWSSIEFVTTAGEAAEGIRIVMPAEYKGKEFQEFVRIHSQKFGEEPDVNAAYAYDTVIIVTQAISNVGYKADRIREYLLGMLPFKGVSGVTKFDENGDCISKEFQRVIFRNGKKVPVEK